jgi:hypothetical protein
MSAGWKTLDIQNSLPIDLWEGDLNYRYRLLDGYSREAETGHLLA